MAGWPLDGRGLAGDPSPARPVPGAVSCGEQVGADRVVPGGQLQHPAEDHAAAASVRNQAWNSPVDLG